jgi:hypothetical protein
MQVVTGTFTDKSPKRFDVKVRRAPYAPAFLLLRGWPYYTYTKTLTYPISGVNIRKMDYPTNEIAGR